MDNICDDLDKLCLQIFDVFEQLYEARGMLEQVMRDGYFGISRARYSLGVKRVSADQFLDADLRATCTVFVHGEQFESEDGESKSSTSSLVLQVDSDKSKCLSNSSKCNPASDSEPSEGLRLRKKIDKSSQVQSSSSSELEKEAYPETEIYKNEKNKILKDSERKEKIFNPINLFGVLVPTHLKKAQSYFENAIQLTVKISNLQSKLQSLRTSYSSLKEKKNEFMNNEA